MLKARQRFVAPYYKSNSAQRLARYVTSTQESGAPLRKLGGGFQTASPSRRKAERPKFRVSMPHGGSERADRSERKATKAANPLLRGYDYIIERPNPLPGELPYIVQTDAPSADQTLVGLAFNLHKGVEREFRHLAGKNELLTDLPAGLMEQLRTLILAWGGDGVTPEKVLCLCTSSDRNYSL